MVRRMPRPRSAVECPAELRPRRVEISFILVRFRVYNGFMEWDNPHFRIENNFREIDPSKGVGWVLIAMGVILICDIRWNKSELRNMKNQNFEISEC